MNKLFKKVFLMATLVAGVSFMSKAQGFEPGAGFTQANFGIGASTWGVPIYAGMDFGVSDKITIGPRVSYRRYNYGYYGLNSRDYHSSIFNISFRGDYHYGAHIPALPDQLDLYGGLSLGYSVWSDKYDWYKSRDGLFLTLQAGARWYFTENWGANAEVSTGSFTGLEIGLSYRF